MAMVNIPSTCDDPQYRYKMPRLISKKEGRGNGSKTCINNMSDVARAIKRPPQYTTKWFGAELGAQSTYTNKEGEGERAIVNGHHDTPIFQTMLDKFIEKYVLCENCHLPEIDMFVKKGVIQAKCAACGWAGELDNHHKLAAYISKNPPDASGNGVVNLAVEDTKGQKSKDERRKEREEKRKAKAADGGDDGEDDDDGEEKPRKEKKEKKDRSGTKEKKEKKVPKLNADGEEETQEEKEARRAAKRAEKGEKGEKKEKKEKSGTKEKKEKREKPAAKKEESDNEDSDDDAKADGDEDVEFDSEIVISVIGIMREFIASKNGAVKPADFFEELRMQQLAKLFDHKIRFYIALEALFPNGAMDAKAVVDQKKVINEVLGMVKIPVAHVLWSFNAYLSLEANEKAVRSYPMVMKTIYDEEWAAEADLLKYYTEEEGAGEPGFEKANTAAAPFLKWLQTAEESDDDEDESSEEN